MSTFFACGGSTEKNITCAPTPLVEPSALFFSDISESSGIQVGNFVVDPATPIPINDHSRLAFADLDGDGLDDIVAHSLFPNPQKGIPFEHLVYRNNGDKTFTDVSDASGLRGVQSGFFTFGDIDNDGDQDCFAGLDIALAGETSSIWLNDGAGHFTKRPLSGVEAISNSANGVFADFNGDGFLDLFSGNGGTTTGSYDNLLFGNGDGTFVDASTKLVARSAQPSNGVVACDYDNDGDTDIFVAHYGVSLKLGWNALWENDGSGGFTNVAVERGFNALATGNYYLSSTGNGRDAQLLLDGETAADYIGSNSFGIDCQDINGDGHLDIYMAAISHPVGNDLSRKWSDPSQLLINQGPAGGFAFTNAFLDVGLPFNEGDIDAAAIDFDNDGRMDLSVTRDKKYEPGYDPDTEYDQRAWFGLYRQGTDGRFASVGLASGINDPDQLTSRVKAGQNLSWSDIDRDGDLDVLIGGRDNGGGGRANFLFENTIGQHNGWLGIRLQGDGVAVNRDALGARVTLSIDDKVFVREVKSSRGTYSSADGRALLFGFGADGCVGTASKVSLEVRWPNGETTVLVPGEFPLNQYLTISYGTGLIVE